MGSRSFSGWEVESVMRLGRRVFRLLLQGRIFVSPIFLLLSPSPRPYHSSSLTQPNVSRSLSPSSQHPIPLPRWRNRTRSHNQHPQRASPTHPRLPPLPLGPDFHPPLHRKNLHPTRLAKGGSPEGFRRRIYVAVEGYISLDMWSGSCCLDDVVVGDG